MRARFLPLAVLGLLAACAEQGGAPPPAAVPAVAPVPQPVAAPVVPPVAPGRVVTLDSFIGHWKGVFTNDRDSVPIEFAIGPGGSMSYWFKGMRQPIGEPRLDGDTLTIPIAQQDVMTLTPVGEALRYTYDGRLGQVTTTLTQR